MRRALRWLERLLDVLFIEGPASPETSATLSAWRYL